LFGLLNEVAGLIEHLVESILLLLERFRDVLAIAFGAQRGCLCG